MTRNKSSVRVISLLLLTGPLPVLGGSLEGSIARGGLLYDKWYAVIGAEKPKSTHKSWPTSNSKKSGDTTWRCKSCHGWDLKGKDGAYAKGSYQTGIKGIAGFAEKDSESIVSVLTNEAHGYGDVLPEGDLKDLANFVSKGQIDMSKYIDYETKQVKGDATKGTGYYDTICAKCHGADGTLPKEMDTPLGKLATSNPWEFMHKVMNGQPDEEMPALRAFGEAVSVDILTYAQTLPTTK